MQRNRNSAGLTRWDVLAVLFLVLLLGTLFTAAMVGCRSRYGVVQARMRCAGRLRQIGLAVFQYEKQYGCMPNALWNAFNQLGPFLGVSTEPGTARPEEKETEVFRCPADKYLPSDEVWNALSYAPLVDSGYLDGDNDGTPDGNFAYCAWSYPRTGYGDGGSTAESRIWQMRSLVDVSPDTALLTEYWNPTNRLNLDQEKPAGYLLRDWSGTGENAMGTINFGGSAAKAGLAQVADVGGYTFLSAFADEAARRERTVSLTRICHNGRINVHYADGSIMPENIKDITNKPPKDIPLWTRIQD